MRSSVFEIDLRHATPDDIGFVFDHCRAMDMQEIVAAGMSRDKVISRHTLPLCFCATVNGTPVVIFGVYEIPQLAEIFLFATDDLNRHVLSFQRLCRPALDKMHTLVGGKKFGVEFWQHKRPALLKWLKRLGFADTGIVFEAQNGDSYRWLEWDKK